MSNLRYSVGVARGEAQYDLKMIQDELLLLNRGIFNWDEWVEYIGDEFYTDLNPSNNPEDFRYFLNSKELTLEVVAENLNRG